MDKSKDYYQILGINSSATKKEVKAAYRSLARKYHPDVNPGNKASEIKFKEVGEAYEILIDEAKRKQYDLAKGIKEAVKNKENYTEQARKQAKEAYTAKKETAKSAAKKNESVADDKKSFNDVFSDFLEGLFTKSTVETVREQQTQKKEQKPSKKGEDIYVDVSVTIAEAHNGTTRKVNVLHTEVCPKCKGKKFIGNQSCTNCSGKGETSKHNVINVKIPANVKENSKIRIQGEGNRGQNDGPNGDLFLVVHVQKHSLFTYDNLNVICEIPISPTEAALGAEIQIPTVDGIISMKIPPETNSGQKFRIAGQGVLDTKENKRGDHLVTVRIEVPRNLSDRERTLYQELAKVRKFNPRENILYE